MEITFQSYDHYVEVIHTMITLRLLMGVYNCETGLKQIRNIHIGCVLGNTRENTLEKFPQHNNNTKWPNTL